MTIEVLELRRERYPGSLEPRNTTKTMYNKHHTRDLLGRKKHKEWLLLLGEKQQRSKQKADFRCPPNPHPKSGAFQDGPGVEQLCGLILGQV